MSGARAISICAADAEDAVQRATEIFLLKGPDEPDGPLLAWMRVVVRREALAIRRRRSRVMAAPTADADRHGFAPELPSPAPGPADALAARARNAEAAAALARLKRDERRAIALQAAGCSYEEIAAICGWTYTKVNRCLAEGRLRLAAGGVAAA